MNTESCIYAICAGIPCGPIIIPEKYRTSEEQSIAYASYLMKTSIKGRAILVLPEKRSILFYRVETKNGEEICQTSDY